MRRSSARSRRASDTRVASFEGSPASASALIAAYSLARAAAMARASSCSWFVLAGWAIHTPAVAPASLNSSAIQSSCSRVRASAGSATSPSVSWATPSRLSLRHTAIRGVLGSRGSRYSRITHCPGPVFGAASPVIVWSAGRAGVVGPDGVAQGLSERGGVIVGPEVHVEQVRLVIEAVVVHLDDSYPTPAQGLDHRLNLLAGHREVAVDRRPPASRGLEADCRGDAHAGRQHVVLVGDRFIALKRELVDPAVVGPFGAQRRVDRRGV